VKTTADELLDQLRAAGTRRALSLVGAAVRAKKAVAGSTVASETLNRGEGRLVVVAEDARAAAELGPVAAAIARGESVVVGTKATLGAALGRAETGVVVILDDGISASLRQAAALSTLTLPRGARGPKKTELVTESG
jgi:ribosomal protein L7Ae-like RNA K-turn-binding protein